jgi:hypothetical protein
MAQPQELKVMLTKDPILRAMRARGIPVTRENYLALADPEADPDDYPAEMEAELPRELRHGFQDDEEDE